MAYSLWLDNLTAYSLQTAIVVSAAGLLAALLRLRNPQVLHRGWQLVLAISVALPFVQPWQSATAVPGGSAQSVVSTLLGPASASFQVSAVLLGVLALGAAARLCWLFIGWIQLQRYRSAQKLEPLPEPLAQLRSGWGREVDVHLLSRLEGAVSFGLRRPAILLPFGFLSLEPAAQRAILLHELLHIRRRDWAFAVIEEFVRSVLWFHPAIHWAIDRIQLTREQVVDGEVVRLLGNRESYLETLLGTAATQSRHRFAAASTFLRARHLRERVALILKGDNMSKPRLIGSTLAVAAALALTAVWAGWSFPLQAPGPLLGPQTLSKKLYKVGGDVSSPQLLQKFEPEYTEEARAAKLQGTVELAIEISPEGRVDDVVVRKGIGLGLDENAMDAIQKWRFAPAVKDGQPVAVSANVEVNFRLL